MDKIEKIKKFVNEEADGWQDTYCDSMRNNILSFLDTLQEPEKGLDVTDFCQPIHPDIAKVLPDVINELTWGEQELEFDLEKEINKWLDGPTTDLRTMARHFAEWGARQLLQGSPMPEDTALFNKGVVEGRRLEREDMLKEAVEGTYAVTTVGHFAFFTDKPIKELCLGDKVRIVILKDNEDESK